MREHRHTAYDAMDAAGVFKGNLANRQSKQFKKAEFPKMVYHPQGERRVTTKGRREYIGGEWMLLGQQTAIVDKIANDAREYEELRAAGWHDHPAKAIAASGKQAPAMGGAASTDAEEAALLARKAKLQKDIKEMEVAVLAGVAKAKATPAVVIPQMSMPSIPAKGAIVAGPNGSVNTTPIAH